MAARRFDSMMHCEVRELDAVSGWDRWQELASRQEAGFAPTLPPPRPASAAMRNAAPTLQPLRGPTVDDVLLIARRNGRICPSPVYWVRIFDRLPDPPPGLTRPIEGRAWLRSGVIDKRIALRDQIEWAATAGTLGLMRDLLAALPEAAWHHMDE
jgi:hypothetical protein